MQQEYVDLRESAGPSLWRSAVQFRSFPILIVGPSASSEKGLQASLALWMDVESVTIFINDWPPHIPFPTEH